MKKSTTLSPALPAAASKLKVPSLTPRNPVAINPLLKKSGAHQDKRRKAIAADAASQAQSAKRGPRAIEDE